MEADDRGLASLTASLPELAGRGERIGYEPPASDPTALPGTAHPALLGALPERDAGDARRVGLEARQRRRAARRHRLEAGGARARERPRRSRRVPPAGRRRTATRPSGSRSTPAATVPAGLYRGTVTVTADGRKHALPVELQISTSPCPTRTACATMVYYEPDQAELYQGRNLDPAYHRFAHRQRVELVHAYDEAAGHGRPRPLRRTRLHEGERLRGAGRGRRQLHRPPELLRPRPGLRGARERLGGVRRLDVLHRRARCRAPSPSSISPTSPTPTSTPTCAELAENVHTNPGPGGRLADLRHEEHHSGAAGRHRHLVRAAPGLRHRGGRRAAKAGAPRVVLQRRPARRGRPS